MIRWRLLRQAAKENVIKASRDREAGSGTAVIDISAEPVNVLVNGALSAAVAGLRDAPKESVYRSPAVRFITSLRESGTFGVGF